VVTPSFNQGRFLEATLRSVVLQGYYDLEYIVTDGGSSDESVEILKKYSRFLTSWVSERDRGQSHAINKGLQRSTGEVVAWLNSDDLYHEAALARVGAEFTQRPDVDFLYGDCLTIDGAGRIVGQRWPPKDYSLEVQLLEGSVIAQPSCFWRRTALERLGPLREDLHVTMDYEYWRRAALQGCRFVRIDDVLSRFRDHDRQKTSTIYRRWLAEEQMLFSEEKVNPAFPLGRHYFRLKTSQLLRFESAIQESEGSYTAAAKTAIRALIAQGGWIRASEMFSTGKRLARLLQRLVYPGA
jgi:glycosyltransferase involved in cell wall biosynthesis